MNTVRLDKGAWHAASGSGPRSFDQDGRFRVMRFLSGGGSEVYAIVDSREEAEQIAADLERKLNQ